MQFTFNPDAASWAANTMPTDATDGGMCVQWWDGQWNRGELFAIYTKDMVRTIRKNDGQFRYYNQFKREEMRNATGKWYKFSRNTTQQDLTNTTNTCLETLTLMRETIDSKQWNASLLDQSHITIKSANLVSNVSASGGPVFEFSLERPLNVSAEENGNLSSQFNFVKGKRYNILTNFIKNTTNITKDAIELTDK